MHTKSNTTSSFLILYVLTTSFFINRILTRYIFENTGKLGWLIILGITTLVLISLPFIYRGIHKIQTKKLTNKLSTFSKIFLYVYLISSSIISLLFLLTLINANWLKQTRYIFILLPFLGSVYYISKQSKDVYLRLTTLFVYPIIIQYLIYIFSNNKSFDLYALVPYDFSINNPFIVIITLIFMFLEMFTILFYINDNDKLISKKQFLLASLFIIFSLCFDSIIVTGQFGNSTYYFPFLYYESWRLLTFGQYLGYLDILSFFYWITSSFCFSGLNMYLTKKYYSKKQYLLSYVLLLFITLYILTHGIYYHFIKPLLLTISTLSLLISTISYCKERLKNEN